MLVVVPDLVAFDVDVVVDVDFVIDASDHGPVAKRHECFVPPCVREVVGSPLKLEAAV